MRNLIRAVMARGRVAAYVPAGVPLIFAWAYIGALLVFPGRGLPRHSHIEGTEPWVGAVFLLFAGWLILGFYEVISDAKRKCGYLVAGCGTAGFAAALFSDGSYLSGGLVGGLAVLSLATYWRFPRRHEAERIRK